TYTASLYAGLLSLIAAKGSELVSAAMTCFLPFTPPLSDNGLVHLSRPGSKCSSSPMARALRPPYSLSERKTRTRPGTVLQPLFLFPPATGACCGLHSLSY